MAEIPKTEGPKRVPMARPCVGTEGRKISLLSNHFSVRFTGSDAVFYQYSVSIKYDDDKDVENKGIGRKVIEKLAQMYSSEFSGKNFAYDGQKSLFTVGPLPQKIFEFKVVLEEASGRWTGSPKAGSPGEAGDQKRQKRVQQTSAFKVSLTFATKIPLKSIAMSLKGIDSPHTQDALRVLDIILRQQQANRGCLLVRQSFFNGDPKNFVDLGGGVTGCRGFHSSFYATEGGLSLNMDVTTTMIMTPGPVIDFLLANQNVREPSMIDWAKAKKMLRNMRIKTKHSRMEFKIIGISELPCNEQRFPMKVREVDGGQLGTVEVTVSEYYQKRRQIEVSWSAKFPCLDVGKPKRPNYLPLEFCDLISLQRYTKALSSQQRASLVEKSRQKPQDRIKTITEAVRSNQYDEDPLLKACGIHIEKQLNKFDGRILAAPTLLLGNGEESVPNRGRWNFNHKKLVNPVRIERWAICNFSARVDMSHISREIINCGRNKGIHIERPFTLVEEDRQWLRAGPVVRVEKMFEKIRAQLPGPPQFLLCILTEKNCDIYGPWKRKNLHEVGIVTQCISPRKLNDQYFTNVLLKINAKLGGMNSMVSVEHKQSFPIIHQTPTLILGLDVSHGSPGRSDLPSTAAVVGSRHWPSISKYRASVRTQSPKLEMIEQLYKPSADGKVDDGMIREILIDFYQSSGARKPAQIIIFRDGVSESQFSQVLNIELDQIIQAYKHLGGDSPLPKFTLIIAQKNHHTKLFQADSPDNVPPGTVVDTKVVHPRNYDFFMCAQNGMIGTSRPTHYHVLLDEIVFSVDDLQKLVHSLSYVYQRSTSAVSVVAPICYAHLAAQQMSQFLKFEDLSDTSSGAGGIAAVPDLPQLHKNVCNSMFFC